MRYKGLFSLAALTFRCGNGANQRQNRKDKAKTFRETDPSPPS